MSLDNFETWEFKAEGEKYSFFDESYPDAYFWSKKVTGICVDYIFYTDIVRTKESAILLTNCIKGELQKAPIIIYQGEYEDLNQKPILRRKRRDGLTQLHLNAGAFFDVFWDAEGPLKPVIFHINGRQIARPFKTGNGMIKMEPLKKSGKDCITIYYRTGYEHSSIQKGIWLANYYYDTPKADCPPFDHADCFELLDVLASTFKETIFLKDSSKKQVKAHANCNIEHFVMAMAKGRTFYNLFGFENGPYEAFIRENKGKLLSDFDPESSAIFKSLWPEIMDPTVQKAALHLIQNCEDEAVQEFMTKFTTRIGQRDHIFYKRYSPDVYDVKITKEGDYFHVHFITEGRAEGRAEGPKKQRGKGHNSKTRRV